MALFRRRKNKDNYAISLDIGTEFVKVLVFRIEDSMAYVVGTGKASQQLSDMHGGRVTDIYGVVKNCEKALTKAFDEAGVAPTQCIIGIAGELVKGTTTAVHYARPEPKEKISVKELKDILSEVQERAFEKTRSELAWETGQAELDVKLVNSAIVDFRIDGYKVTNPVGFQGRDVTVGIFNAFAPIVHFGALQTITEELGLDLLAIAAEPYAVSRCVGSEDAGEFSSIFIDIGGGTTDIAVVRAGGVEGTKMFAIGGRVFTKTVADALGQTFPEAEEFKLDYSNGKISKESEEYKKARHAIENNCEVWLSGVELALEEFTNIDLLPSKILLCGGGSLLPEIKESLEQDRWWRDLPFSKKPHIDFIQPKEILSVTDETRKLTGSQDITPMALANLAIDLAGETDVVEGILDSIVEGLKK
ncbi:MAG TPA: cell division FtsA domain-containing protein [bacterium]|nr:cell division FtsA domain-containing protein [bacterium]